MRNQDVKCLYCEIIISKRNKKDGLKAIMLESRKDMRFQILVIFFFWQIVVLNFNV